MKHTKKSIIGNEYCDVCEDYFPIKAWIDAPENETDEAPQLYLEGMHLHLLGIDERLYLPPICIWVDKPQELKQMLDVLEKRLKALQLGVQE